MTMRKWRLLVYAIYLAALVGGLWLLVTSIPSQAAERSGRWPEVRKAYLADHPSCEACGCGEKCDVHHIRPFHAYPALELEPSNLIALCPRCHLVFGHLGDWHAWNPCVREDAARHLRRVQVRPYTPAAAATFQKRFGEPMRARPKRQRQAERDASERIHSQIATAL
ncbi:MAG: HNH endonuclease [Planctomycetaceae bacterium]|nr:HNH endonuclease [Planctomycetaceae bacterium]